MPSISLEILPVKSEGYHSFLNVTISGTKFRLILDTGASRTVLDNRVAETLELQHHLETSEDKAIGLGEGELETQTLNLEGIELAGVKLPPINIGILDLQQINDTYDMLEIPNIDGMLGNDLLLTLNAIIDYQKREIRFQEQ